MQNSRLTGEGGDLIIGHKLQHEGIIAALKYGYVLLPVLNAVRKRIPMLCIPMEYVGIHHQRLQLFSRLKVGLKGLKLVGLPVQLKVVRIHVPNESKRIIGIVGNGAVMALKS